ncbi:MAG: membrane or secreted protein [Pirellulales bacterium]
MVRKTLLVVVCGAAVAVTGCRGTGMPQIFGPGSAKYQQTQAQRFDPYPENDIGPRVEGSRPDGYTAPPAEAYRGRSNQWSAPTYGS